jgi:hypothetical protein
MYEIVEAPKLRPACHGLVESGNVVARGGGRWENGVQFSPLGCYAISGTEADCPPIQKDALLSCEPVIQFRPYVLTIGLEWAANAESDPKDVAQVSLEAGTSAKLEDFLWNGATAGDGPRNPLLSEGDDLGSFESARDALGAVEGALLGAPTGGAGTLYVSPLVANHIGDALYENDGKLYTKATCSLVIVGNFPVGQVAGHVGEVDLFIGDIFLTDTRDEYRSNEYDVMAERLAIAAFNSCASFVAGVEGIS